jgi:hypothetical protein
MHRSVFRSLQFSKRINGLKNKIPEDSNFPLRLFLKLSNPTDFRKGKAPLPVSKVVLNPATTNHRLRLYFGSYGKVSQNTTITIQITPRWGILSPRGHHSK